jgi:hypothetical protein
MPKVGEVTKDDLKAQLNEYHVLVVEIIGGMSAQITTISNRLFEIESKLAKYSDDNAALQESNRLLIKEVLSLKQPENND